MKSKKIIVGAALITLALAAGVVTYAAANEADNPQEEDVVYQDNISMGSEDALSLENIDKDNLPEGVYYADEVSDTDNNDANTFSLGK